MALLLTKYLEGGGLYDAGRKACNLCIETWRGEGYEMSVSKGHRGESVHSTLAGPRSQLAVVFSVWFN